VASGRRRREARGHRQRGSPPATFRPTITADRQETRVLAEQNAALDPLRLGRSTGRLDAAELRAVDDALLLVLSL
jgi:mRNA interferase MazF